VGGRRAGSVRSCRFGIIKKQKPGLPGQEFAPFRGSSFDGKNGTGGHIIQADRAQRVDKGGDTGIVGEQGDGIVIIIQTGDHLLEDVGESVVEIGNDNDIFLLHPKFPGKQFGCMPGPAGGAGDKTIDADTCPDQSASHCGSIFFTSVVQLAVNIGGTDMVPAALCMSDDQKGLHYCY